MSRQPHAPKSSRSLRIRRVVRVASRGVLTTAAAAAIGATAYGLAPIAGESDVSLPSTARPSATPDQRTLEATGRIPLPPLTAMPDLATGCKELEAGGVPLAKRPLSEIRWIPVGSGGGPDGPTFAGCLPAELAYPQWDDWAALEALRIRAGVQNPPLPAFLANGSLAGYVIPTGGFVVRSVAESSGQIPRALIEGPPVPSDFVGAVR